MSEVPDIRSAAMTSKAWPYEEARKLLKRWPDGKPDGQPMVFETGYGPSGLPHIGTFTEVLRTTMVRGAYEELTGNPTRLIAFSDDMDVLRHWNDILDIMLPTLREERRQTYSPILPVSPTSGRVLQVPVEVVDADEGIIAFTDEDGGRVRQSALGGQSKCQWKVDWAMRWVALGVDYEMYGKDLTDSGVQSGRIAAVLGGRKPEGLIYEMFLDEKGEKISKSKGNGLSIEDWLTYGSDNSLAFYLYREPKKAKNLHLGLVPRAVDEYHQFRGNYPEQPIEQKLGNPAHHIHGGEVPAGELPLTYGLLLNLVSLPGVQDKDIAWKFVQRYAPDTSPEKDEELDALIGLAVNYARDFVVPTLKRRAPTEIETAALRDLD